MTTPNASSKAGATPTIEVLDFYTEKRATIIDRVIGDKVGHELRGDLIAKTRKEFLEIPTDDLTGNDYRRAKDKNDKIESQREKYLKEERAGYVALKSKLDESTLSLLEVNIGEHQFNEIEAKCNLFEFYDVLEKEGEKIAAEQTDLVGEMTRAMRNTKQGETVSTVEHIRTWSVMRAKLARLNPTRRPSSNAVKAIEGEDCSDFINSLDPRQNQVFLHNKKTLVGADGSLPVKYLEWQTLIGEVRRMAEKPSQVNAKADRRVFDTGGVKKSLYPPNGGESKNKEKKKKKRQKKKDNGGGPNKNGNFNNKSMSNAECGFCKMLGLSEEHSKHPKEKCFRLEETRKKLTFGQQQPNKKLKTSEEGSQSKTVRFNLAATDNDYLVRYAKAQQQLMDD
jgi:hypothetical protein